MSFSESPAHNPDAEAEEIATAQLENEKKEKFPETAEQLIEATENAVDSLAQRLVRNSQAHEYLTELSARVQRYLFDSETHEASLYAKALVARSGKNDQTESAIDRQIVSEINPLLFEIQRAVVESNAMTQAGNSADVILIKEGGLIDALKTGSAGAQKTTSLFGFLEGLDASEKAVPRKIVVVNPLGQDASNKEYWQGRMKTWSEVTGKKQESYEKLIAMRSANAVFELDLAAEKADADGDQKTFDALTTLSEYIDDRIDPLSKDFKKTVRQMSFLQGKTDDIFDLLNAAEIVKHKNPQLYARLLGISAGKDSSEADRSDLFGNIFQIALYRSMHHRPKLAGTKGLVGQQVLTERLNGLTEMDTEQLSLHHLNAEQMKALQAELKTELQKAPEEQNLTLITTITDVFLYRSKEVQLDELFEAVSEAGEEKQAIRERIETRHAKRKELRQLFKKLESELEKDTDGYVNVRLSPLLISDQLALGMLTKRQAVSAIAKARKAIETYRSDLSRVDLLCELAEVEIKNGLDPKEMLEVVKGYCTLENAPNWMDLSSNFLNRIRVENLYFMAGLKSPGLLEVIKERDRFDFLKNNPVGIYCELALLKFKMGKDPTELLNKAKTFNENSDRGIDKKSLDAFFEIAMAEIKIGRDASETISKIIENSHRLDFSDQVIEKILNLVSCQLEFGQNTDLLLTLIKKKARTVKSLYKIAGFEAKNKLDFSETLELAKKRGKSEPNARIDFYKTIFFDSEIAMEDENKERLLQTINNLKFLSYRELFSSTSDFGKHLVQLINLEARAGLAPSVYVGTLFENEVLRGIDRIEIVKSLIKTGRLDLAYNLYDRPRTSDLRETPELISAFLKGIGLEAEKLLEEERHVDVREARELFGQNLFGPDQVEKAFVITDQNGQEIKLVDFSPEQRQQVEQMLVEKLNEPDIQKFLQKPENKEAIKKGEWLLMLRVDKIRVGREDVRLTMEKMKEFLEPDMMGKEQGKLFSWPTRFNGEDCYQKDTPRLQWTLVTKKVVSSTLGLQHQPMTEAISVEANRVGFDSTKIKRRTPVETFFDFFTVLRTMATDNRILLDAYDWSKIRLSDRSFVNVGFGDSHGLRMDGRSSTHTLGYLGASLSR